MKTTALMRTVTAEDLAARDVLVPPELKEVTFTEVKNFLNARCDYAIVAVRMKRSVSG